MAKDKHWKKEMEEQVLHLTYKVKELENELDRRPTETAFALLSQRVNSLETKLHRTP